MFYVLIVLEFTDLTRKEYRHLYLVVLDPAWLFLNGSLLQRGTVLWFGVYLDYTSMNHCELIFGL